MIFDNLFKKNNDAAQVKEERQFQTTGAVLMQQQGQADELAMLQRREVLTQLTQWQQDRSPTLRKLFEKLCAYHVDAKTKELIKSQYEIPCCSLGGAQELVNYIEPLDHNVMLANWSDKTLIVTMRDAIAHPLRRFIRDNHRELGMDIQHAEYVFWLIVNTIEPTYWRGWNDGERRKDREMIKINEVKAISPEKKKGLFGYNMGG